MSDMTLKRMRRMDRHLHGNCKIADEKEKPFGIKSIGLPE